MVESLARKKAVGLRFSALSVMGEEETRARKESRRMAERCMVARGTNFGWEASIDSLG